MGGGLMQLVAYGAQDIYLTGNPQITFFKVVYRRHTNFSMEAIQQTLNGTAGYNQSVTATISRNGDLIHRMTVEHLPSPGNNISYCANYASTLLKEVELEIGGQKIDKHFGHFMEAWSELTQPNPGGAVATQIITSAEGKRTGGTLFQSTTGMGGVNGSANTDAATEGAGVMFIPLQFWFCRNPGLALPLIALQYHEVKVILDHTLGTNGLTSVTSNILWCDYIYLDTDERRRFAQVSHEYLIEQVQEQSSAVTGGNQAVVSNTVDLNFNHPVKELIFTTDGLATGQPLAIGTVADTYQLKLNGHDRFAEQDREYFQIRQPLDHHTAVPGFNIKEILYWHHLWFNLYNWCGSKFRSY